MNSQQRIATKDSSIIFITIVLLLLSLTCAACSSQTNSSNIVIINSGMTCTHVGYGYRCIVQGTVKNNGYKSFTDTVGDLSTFAEFYDANGNIITDSNCANWHYFQMLDHGETRDFWIEYRGPTQPASYDVWVGRK